ncbi:MAG TPA: glycosyltransferase, partial [Nitrospira sp.]|nr:glycosyltransferase [Nitrospira sp.]
SGGGVQVAASFLDELSKLIEDPEAVRRFPWLREGLTIEASLAVLVNLNSTAAERLCAKREERRWSDGSIWRHVRPQHDVSFTVFGPEYGRRRAARRVVGFADATSLFPSPLRWRGIRAQGKALIRRRVSRRLLRGADHVVVEATHVRDALVVRWGMSSTRMTVVPNTVNGVLCDPIPDRFDDSDALLLGYVTRAYAHKNLALLGPIGRELRERHGLEAHFLLTLEDAEWSSLDDETRSFSANVGPLTVHELRAFYSRCTASIFPSLLECFSVTPLEALACGVPLVASDRPFVREIAQDAAWYFDPFSAVDAAATVAKMLNSGAELRERCALGRSIARSWPTARDRALGYLEIIDAELSLIMA